MSKNIFKPLNKIESTYIRCAGYSFTMFLLSSILVYSSKQKISVITILFIPLIALIIYPFFKYRDFFNPFNIFFITTQFLFVYNMIDVYINKSSFRYGNIPKEYFNKAFFFAISIMIIWYLLMFIGYEIAGVSKESRIIKKIDFSLNHPRKIGNLLLIISVLSFVYILITTGGLSGMITGLSSRVETYAGKSYLIKLVSFGTLASLIFLMNDQTRLSLFIIIQTFIMLSLFGGRGTAIFTSILPYLIVYENNNKKTNKFILFILGTLITFMAIGLGNYRLYQEIRLDFKGIKDILSTMGSAVQGGEILPSLAASLSLGNVDYALGSTLKNIFYAPIPRTIWANKPLIDETGIIGRLLIGEDGWGLPPGPYGVAYYNFGYIGVIILGFITGYLIKKVYDQMVASKSRHQNYGMGLIYYAILTPSLFNFFSTSAQINLIWYTVMFLIIKRIDRLF